MSPSTVLILVLTIVIWGSVYLPISLVARVFLIGSPHADGKSVLFALFWPVTVPLFFIVAFVSMLSPWRR